MHNQQLGGPLGTFKGRGLWGPVGTFKGRGLWLVRGWWETGQQALPSSCQDFPPVFFVTLFYIKHSSKIPFPPLQMTHLKTGLCEICFAFSHAVSSFPPFRKLSAWTAPPPLPAASWPQSNTPFTPLVPTASSDLLLLWDSPHSRAKP